jgi:hypothetical protein
LPEEALLHFPSHRFVALAARRGVSGAGRIKSCCEVETCVEPPVRGAASSSLSELCRTTNDGRP